MAESPLRLNIEYFNNPDKSGALGLGLVYVGKPDLDPEIEANRVTVTIVQEDGTRVTIAPNQQPLTLNAGGNVDYLGSPVTVLVNGIYSVKVLDLAINQKFYVPFSNEFPELVAPFDNVAEMITAPGDFDGQQAYLGGYYDIGDGGGGPVYWDATSTETADNGMIFGAFAVGRWKRQLDTIDLKQFGAKGDGVTTDDSTALTNAFAALATIRNIVISGDHSFSIDVSTSESDISVTGSGSLTALSGTGANITFTGDRIKFDLDVRGNEQQAANISAKTTTPDTLTVDSGTWTIGDAVINRTTDEFKRVIWTGVVTNVAGSVLAVSTNPIDGDFANVATSTNLELIKGLNTLHGQVEFNGCDEIDIKGQFNRDLYIYNCNNVVIGDIRTKYAQTTIIFSRWVEISSINGDEPNFYGLTVQASADVSAGNLIFEKPGFSGLTIKGLHDGQFTSVNVHNAPIMGDQIVRYPGSAPDSVNPNLQNDLLNENINYGDVQFRQCNFGLAVKEIEGFQISNLLGDRNYKTTLFLDSLWSDIQIGNFRTKEQNAGGGNTATSSASLWAQNGSGLQIGKIQLDGNEVTSGKWAAYLDNVSGWDIGSINCNGIEQFVGINACDGWKIGRFYSTASVDGFQLLKITASSQWTIDDISCDESVNATIDRFVFIETTSDDWTIKSFNLNFDGVTSTPSDGIRNNGTGSNNNVLNGTCNNATNTFRNTGACDHLSVRGMIAGTGTTNSVSAAAVTDYLIIVHCMGTIVDVTGALTNKVVVDNI